MPDTLARRFARHSSRPLRKLTACGVALTMVATPMSAWAQQGDAVAAWKADVGMLQIGFAQDATMPNGPGAHERFRSVLEDSLGMPVDVFEATNMATLVDAIASGRIDIAFLSATAYMTGQTVCDCLEPLAAPTSEAGARAVRAVLYGVDPALGDITALADTAIAIGRPDDVMSGIVPRVAFRWNGQPLEQSGLDLMVFETNEAMVAGVSAGKVGAAFGWSYATGTDAQLLGSPLEDRLTAALGQPPAILWQSDDFVLSPVVAHDDVPLTVMRTIRNLLLGLHTTHPLAFDEISGPHAGPLQAVDRSDYRSYADIVSHIRFGATPHAVDAEPFLVDEETGTGASADR